MVVAWLRRSAQVLGKAKGSLPAAVILRLLVGSQLINLLDDASGVERALFTGCLSLRQLGDSAGMDMSCEEPGGKKDVSGVELHDCCA